MVAAERIAAATCVKRADSATSTMDPGMVLVTVGCFSGYTPTLESLQMLKDHPQVRAP